MELYTVFLLGGAFGQVVFGEEQPYVPLDPYFPAYNQSTGEGNPCFPLGQYWLRLTNVDRAWTRAGYNIGVPIVLDPTDPNRVIAFIDTGIETTHPEFGLDVNGTEKIHEDSRSIFDSRSDGIPPYYPCIPDDLGIDELRSIDDSLCEINSVWINPHGTIEAGLAVAYGDNNLGIAGVCWDASALVIRAMAVVPYDVCDECYMGCSSDEPNIATAIRYAAGWDLDTGSYPDETVRSRIICLPSTTIYEKWCEDLTDEEYSEEVRAAVVEAYDRGVIIIAIAGNDGSLANGPINVGLPLHPYTITVGGTKTYTDCNGDDYQWVHPMSRINPDPDVDFPEFNACINDDEYSEIEFTPDGRIKALSVVAPIDNIFSTWHYDCDIECDDGDPNDPSDDTVGYRMTTSPGTSWAAGQVAGIVALLLRARPDLTPAQVKQVLEVTAQDLVDKDPNSCTETLPGYDRFTGYGLVDAHAALVYATKLGYPADWNGDGSVGPIDPVLYLADYASGEPTADLNLDTSQTADDMAIYLDSYAGN